MWSSNWSTIWPHTHLWAFGCDGNIGIPSHILTDVMNSCFKNASPRFSLGTALTQASACVDEMVLIQARSLMLLLFFKEVKTMSSIWPWNEFWENPEGAVLVGLSELVNASVKRMLAISSPEILSVEDSSKEAVSPCNRRSINWWVEWQLPRKAAAEEIWASRKPKPPKRIGKDASEIEDWVILPRAWRRPQSKRPSWKSAEPGGTVRRRWLILNKLRQILSKWNAICGLSRSGKRSCASSILSTRDLKKLSKNSWEPIMGEPSNSALLDDTHKRWISGGKAGNSWSPDGQNTSHLPRLICKPTSGPLDNSNFNMHPVYQRKYHHLSTTTVTEDHQYDLCHQELLKRPRKKKFD